MTSMKTVPLPTVHQLVATQLVSQSTALMDGYRGDLDIDNELILDKKPNGFVHITCALSTHLYLIPKKNVNMHEVIPYLFGRLPRRDVYRQSYDMIANYKYENVKVYSYFDGKKLHFEVPRTEASEYFRSCMKQCGIAS